MRPFLSFLFAAALFAVSARAQVTVELTQDQDQFLSGESMQVAVRITNRSGQTLRLGSENDWLTFNIESRDQPGEIVEKTGDAPVVGEFTLESSSRATKRVDLAPWFSLNRPGRYAITATVRLKEWNSEVTSPPLGFYIIPGTKLWEREVGVPGSAKAGSSPEVRRYVLQQANYLRSQIRLYLRVTDEAGLKNLRVIPIGPMISFSRPEPQVDDESNLHVLFQSGPRSYSYTVYNTEGKLLLRQTYDIANNARPKLRPNEEGKLMIVGGARRKTPNDFPPEPESQPDSKPEATAAPGDDTKPAASPDSRTNARKPAP